jgi:hypothetical protein
MDTTEKILLVSLIVAVIGLIFSIIYGAININILQQKGEQDQITITNLTNELSRLTGIQENQLQLSNTPRAQIKCWISSINLVNDYYSLYIRNDGNSVSRLNQIKFENNRTFMENGPYESWGVNICYPQKEELGPGQEVYINCPYIGNVNYVTLTHDGVDTSCGLSLPK